MKYLSPILLGSIVGTLAMPLAASATEGHPGHCCGSRDPDIEQAEFVAWQAEAITLQIDGGGPIDEGVRVAAELYERSASLRPIYDAEGVDALRKAAHLLYDRDSARAIDLLMDAATWSLLLEDEVTAAMSYLDAAEIVARAHWLTPMDVQRITDWIATAQTLANSADVTPTDRELILSRIAG